MRKTGEQKNYVSPSNSDVDDSEVVRQFTRSDIEELVAESHTFKVSQRKFALYQIFLMVKGRCFYTSFF